MNLRNLPMPNEAHPSLANYADAVRRHKDQGPILIPRLRRAFATFEPEDIEPVSSMLDPVRLTPQKIGAPAPFVARHHGDEAMYFWYAWGDGNGRYITTDAELVYR